MPRPDREGGSGVLDKPETRTKKPKLYRVLLLNDDYTTMEFVIHVLESLFDKRPAEAYRIMMEVHLKGSGVCGAYTYEVAETKVAAVHDLATSQGFPLRADMEEA